MKKVAVVILNYNGKGFLEKFLPDVLLHSEPVADVWVADNCSSDGSVELLRQKFPQVSLIVNESNGGFSTGYNQALSQIKAEYYILLNSDIEVTPNWIEPVIKLMDQDITIAACQPKIRSYYNKPDFEYAGASGGFLDKYGYPFCRGRLFQHLETDQQQYDDAIEVFWATGACFFVRAEVYHHLGGLDDDFFAHMEEIDFCWRAKNKGYKIMVCPQSVVFHIGGGTLPKSSARKTYLNFRNNFVLLYKNLPDNRLMKVFIARLFLDGAAALKFLLQGGVKDFAAVIRAHFYFYSHFAALKKKRKNLLQTKVTCLYGGNIAFDHYLWQKKKFTDLNPEHFS
ncbi:MAG: glycosyl transferase family 2 [Bacteroidetes bacterium GWF2_41_31]|nr:MAG: glycosyl transferase family 2 [Bacteroidetes bacterium GWF2_41_31]